MAEKLTPVDLEEFQAFLFAKRDEGIRFAPVEKQIIDTESVWPYYHPQTNEVCAMVEVPRNEHGTELEDQKVYYVLK